MDLVWRKIEEKRINGDAGANAFAQYEECKKTFENRFAAVVTATRSNEPVPANLIGKPCICRVILKCFLKMICRSALVNLKRWSIR